MQWIEDKYDEKSVSALSQNLSVSPTLSKFLLARGITTPESATAFLKPRLAHLINPFEIAGMSEAVDRIIDAINNKEHILIVGDYDVDGITSTYIVYSVIKELGGDIDYDIPNRFNSSSIGKF